MSKTKASGTTRLGRDSRPKYLGIKLYDGQKVKTGNIIVRQRGIKVLAGKNVSVGRDDSLYALKEGVIKFTTKRKLNFDGSQKIVKVVNVL
ncbi:MAG: 50S ribosomal protein L27 [Candidatus Pacebacteria bacterium]|jgi:large subunit ribosomal protein L27|nr:50S ribosomal protein L27 [Candidatus Paceibacterota bacterium]NMB47466.1 50S ribosomal protein L27 [Patescibacteria group bacterium]MDD2796553.1 50S ribosomal protein L27 [Candidatus Paceibacterota bacterium]MDD3047790.1 50S ribosomal protein L27 [Candidatus Paceibacterota bacterium]MDD3509724.1 50S ribosomal protein L27 [Candidatus Paceibacterota bacterium]